MGTLQLTPLVSASQLRSFGSFAEVFSRTKDDELNQIMLMATRVFEGTCGRRLAPFASLVETDRLYGIDPEQVGGSDTMPLSLQGSLGMDEARAYGVQNLVRDFWLKEVPPRMQDDWTCTIEQVVLRRFWGDTEVIPGSQIDGPQIDTGHCRLRLGTFAPIGTFYDVTYSGGYSPVPYDLQLGCILQAFKLGALGIVPLRSTMKMDDLDMELDKVVGSYVRV